MKTGVRYESTTFKLKGNKTICHIYAFINIPGLGHLYDANENVRRLCKMLMKEHKIEIKFEKKDKVEKNILQYFGETFVKLLVLI